MITMPENRREGTRAVLETAKDTLIRGLGGPYLYFSRIEGPIVQNPEYCGLKDKQARLHPGVAHPESVFHYGCCFAEALERWLDLERFSAELRQRDSLKRLASAEAQFAKVVCSLEQQVFSDDHYPYESYDFLAADMKRLLEAAASSIGLPVKRFSGKAYSAFPFEPSSLPLFYLDSEVRSGRAVGIWVPEDEDAWRFGEVGTFMAGVEDPESGVRTLCCLLSAQLRIAQAQGTISRLGEIIRQDLLDQPTLVNWLSFGFGETQAGVLDQIRQQGKSPAHYLYQHVFSYYPVLKMVYKGDDRYWVEIRREGEKKTLPGRHQPATQSAFPV
jgi:hypothetical protein